MKVLVTGATGFVGAHSAVALRRAGHSIRALVRDVDKARRVAAAVGFDDDLELARGDITDAPSVDRALSGCDAVLHAAASVNLERRRAAEVLTVNAIGTRNVLRGAAEQGLARIVHVSSTSALDASHGRPLGVDSPVAAGSGYAGSKAAAEQEARHLQAEGAPVHITYPAGVVGPAAGESLGETSTAMARFIAAGVLPTPGAALSLVDVRDLADIHRRLLDSGEGPARVMCGGTLLTMRDLGARLRALTGRRFPVLPVPPTALRLAGRMADRAASMVRVELPVSDEAMTLITTWPGTDDNAPAELGVRYRSIEDTLATALRAWLDAGLITPRQAGHLAPGAVSR
ncbi:MAG: SDR family NAD(P)-dependent oxidoreductase [Acidimicrobiales bacterium]|nr:SDR family NAD(P)-dependent oxidoreductase [Acidimicrobiales bacterium]